MAVNRIVHPFALLAPVPLEHLKRAQEVKPKVSFGSNDFQLFRKLDDDSEGLAIPVMIYASHEHELKHNFEVTWVGWYLGSSEGRPDKSLRPATAIGETWGTHWFVEGLRELPPSKHLPVSEIEKLSGGKWKAAPVRGPTKVPLSEALHNRLHEALALP